MLVRIQAGAAHLPGGSLCNALSARCRAASNLREGEQL